MIKKSRVFIIYFLVIVFAALLFGLSGLLNDVNPITSLIFGQLLLVALGIFHCFGMKKLGWDSEKNESREIVKKDELREMLFTILLSLAGCIVFVIIHHFVCNKPLGFSILMSGMFIAFPVPYFVYKCLLSGISIPESAGKIWIYPKDPVQIDWSKIKDGNNFTLITLMFPLNFGNSENEMRDNTRGYHELLLWEIFYEVIKRWTEDYPQKPIQLLNEGKATGWTFYSIYSKQKWYEPYKYYEPEFDLKKRKYYDPELTVKNNGIIAKTKIYCEPVAY